MPHLTPSCPTRLGVVSFVSVACAIGDGCSGGSSDTNAVTGGTAPSGGSGATGALPSGGTGALASGGTSSGAGASTGGAVPSGGSWAAVSSGGSGATGALPSGGTGAVASGGAGAAMATNTGGQSCIPANPNGPAGHATAGYDTQPCSECHGAALSGGIVYGPSGTATVAQATVTITPVDGTALTAVTGSTGMFYFWDTPSGPYQVCVSKCPDTICSTETDHLNAGDCGTCHGVTTTKIHFP
jgi:hypothetical protein